MAFEWWCGLLLGLLFGWLSHALLDWLLGLRGAHGRFVGALSDLEAERDQLRANLFGVERQFKDSVNTHAGLEKEVLELRSRLEEFDANAAELAASRLTLRDFDALTARVPVLQADLSHFKTRTGELEGTLESQNAELADLKSRVQELEPLQARIAGLEHELSESRASPPAEFFGLRQRADEAEAARARLEQAIGASASELAAVRGKLELAERAQGRLPELEMLVTSMQARLVESQGIASQLQSRDAELSALRSRLAASQSAGNQLTALEAQLAQVQARLSALESEHGRISRELADRESDLFEMAGQLNMAQSSQSRARKLEDELSSRDREIAALRASAADHEQASLRVAQLEQALEDARVGLDGAESGRSRLSLLESQHAALNAQLEELAPLQSRAAKLETEMGLLRAKLELARTELERERANRTSLVMQLSNSSAETARLRAELEDARKVPDDLTRVDGIGAVFARRLNAVGIAHYAQLAQTAPERLREIIKPEDWQKIDFEHWASDAALLSRGETPPKRARAHERLARITGIGDVYEKRLHEAGITTYAQLAQTTVERLMEIAGSDSRSEVELWITEAGAYAQGKRPNREREKVVRGRLSEAEDELGRLRGELRRAESLRRDRFEVMTQIGDAKQRRLYGAGIYLFEELARTPESRLREIFDHEDLDYALIAREAAEYARDEIVVVKGHRADRFERLTGVSEADARALHAAGVYSFEELSQLSGPRLSEIVGRHGLESWIDEAGLFASGRAPIDFIDAGKRRRDQLWRIDGIGEVFESRLNRAGLFSFDDLASCSPDRLLEIIKPQSWEYVDTASWIAQARERGAREERE